MAEPYWRDKVVLVTGGSSGFGRAIAEAFAQAGARVLLAALDDGQLEPAAEALRSAGGDVTPFAVDITAQDEVDRLFGQVQERFGRLDALVNCAGKSARGAILDTAVEDFRDLLDLNFFAMVRCTRAAAALLCESRGHIVNIGSLAAKSASRFVGAYPVSKHAVAAYSQQLRLELADRGVHVLLVCPGPLTRADAGRRYDRQAESLPASARQPGGGVRVKTISPQYMARRILKACQRRQPELVVPAKARLLFAVAQLFPSLGDWIVRRMTA
jgi:NAD(P)-dependent dehydrogenase (short-subunit alcohol dehydrogenase family)